MTVAHLELTYVPRWVTHLGALSSCVSYLGRDYSDGWLFGGTGHAFVVNIGAGACPSGPTAWRTSRLFELARGLGVEVDGVCALRSGDSFDQYRAAAWELAKESLEAGLPCYGFLLRAPEFYPIVGCDDEGYHFVGEDGEPSGPVPWQTLGEELGVLEVYRVQLCEPVDDATAVRNALTFALEHAAPDSPWVLEGYTSGPAGFLRWRDDLLAMDSSHTQLGFGVAYNAAVWAECRRQAVAFLAEVRARWGTDLPGLSEASAAYGAVAEALSLVTQRFPFFGGEPQHLQDQSRREQAAQYLTEAADAEKVGLEMLRRLCESISATGV